MLDHHPQLAVSNDTHFITHGAGSREIDAQTPLEPAMVERAVRFRTNSGKAGFHRLELPEARVREIGASAPTYASFVERIFDELARVRGKPLAGDKTPDYVRAIKLLSRLFPQARFVHIVRDGRDVTLSLLDWARIHRRGPARLPLWDEEPVAACAQWWSGMLERGRRDGARLGPDRYLEIRYEDLTTEPADTLHRIAAFLRLPFAEEMLSYHEDQPRLRRPGRTSNLPPTVGLRDWRTELPAREVAIFESIAGETLERFGYPPSGRS